MPLHWTISSLPELEHMTPAQRRATLRRALRVGTRIRLVLRPLAIGLIAAFASGLVLALLGMDTAARASMPFALVLAAVAAHLAQVARIRRELHLQLRSELSGDRLPVCLECGYDLAGADAERCPECGASTRA